ncbi:MAG TPA: amino acid permease [Methanoregulaceae archaeon]|nr:amino acid permease [Methanoregulaceae archaeon]
MSGSSGFKSPLKRELGLWEVTLSGIGIILGAGIYALIGAAATRAGNAIWLSFAVSALVAAFTALSYAELSSMFPLAGAEYEYTDRALGKNLAFVVGWLIIFSGIIGASAVALGFAGYLGAIMSVPAIPASIALIAVLSIILFYGIRESALLASIFTLIEAGGLILIIIAGIPYLGRVNYLEMPLGISGLFSAAALVFFAYMGFEEIVKFSEETRSPERTIPKALLLALVICTALYILVSISAVSVLGWEALSMSEAPFSDVAQMAWGGNASLILSVIALFATSNTVLLMLFASSRISYAMARSGSLPAALSGIHPGRRTPWIAVIAVALGAMAFLFFGNIGFIANIANFTLFVTFLVVNMATIILRYRDPGRPRPFVTPVSVGKLPVLPVLGIVSCIFLLSQLEPEVMAIGVMLTVAGILVAFLSGRHSPEQVPGM